VEGLVLWPVPAAYSPNDCHARPACSNDNWRGCHCEAAAADEAIVSPPRTPPTKAWRGRSAAVMGRHDSHFPINALARPDCAIWIRSYSCKSATNPLKGAGSDRQTAPLAISLCSACLKYGCCVPPATRPTRQRLFRLGRQPSPSPQPDH